MWIIERLHLLGCIEMSKTPKVINWATGITFLRGVISRLEFQSQIPEIKKSSELIMSVRFKSNEPSCFFKNDFEIVVI